MPLLTPLSNILSTLDTFIFTHWFKVNVFSANQCCSKLHIKPFNGHYLLECTVSFYPSYMEISEPHFCWYFHLSWYLFLMLTCPRYAMRRAIYIILMGTWCDVLKQSKWIHIFNIVSDIQMAIQENINTLGQRQNDSQFTNDIFKFIFLHDNSCVVVQISLKYVTKGNKKLRMSHHWFRSWLDTDAII